MLEQANTLKEYAPVLISVYNRFNHLKDCVESLKLNFHSKDSNLYIVSDAPYNDKDRDDIAKIRDYVINIQGFKDVVLIGREVNLGSFMSINSAIDFVMKKHGKVIFLEDDNIVSNNFLQFMNDGLDFYQDDPSVFSIAGYNYPVKMPTAYKYDIYKWQGYSPWGVGFWRNKWENIDWSRDGIDSFLADKAKVKAINNVGEHVLLNLLAGIKTKNEIAADAALCIHLINNNMFSIFPVVSKVRNMGNDGMGEHGSKDDKYKIQRLDSNRSTIWITIEASPVINKILRKHFRTPVATKIACNLPGSLKTLMKYLLNYSRTSQ